MSNDFPRMDWDTDWNEAPDAPWPPEEWTQKRCPHCDGEGLIERYDATVYHPVQQLCRHCHGSGLVPKEDE